MDLASRALPSMIDSAQAAGVHRVFEAHARAAPDAPAVLLEDREVSYAELNAMANRLAHRLRGMGVAEESFVVVCARRTVETLAAILSVLKTGGAFVPLDPDDPPRRLQAVLDVVQPRVVLAAPEDQARFRGRPTLWVSSPARSADESDLPAGAGPGDAACAYYTSGSSGAAKAVVLDHRALLHKFRWYVRDLLGERPVKVPLVSRLTFGQSQYQLFAPWLRGDPVWLLEDRVAGDPVALLRALSAQPQVALLCVPQLWEAMLNAIEREAAPVPHTVALLCLAGDSISRPLVDRSFAALPELELWNLYAATETGVSVAGRVHPGQPLRLGKPITNVNAHVLDADLQPISVDQAGELHIGGPGLARGYLGRPELTAQLFVPDPSSNRPGARLFRSGDLVRRVEDGSLELVGRSDRLIKLRGFRLDPPEVEAAIAEHPRVAHAAITPSRDDQGREQLVAHVVPADIAVPTLADLRRFLASRLPAYMVPSRLVVLDSLPMTPSGKLDRRALRIPVDDDHRRPPRPSGPRNELEHWLVELWAKVLGVESIGVTDDFFELGGESLAAVQVVEAIERKTGAALAPTALLEASTPERLAMLIDLSQGQRATPLVAIRSEGSRRPFFCVAPLPTSLLPIARLAGHLDPGRPVYGLQPYGLDDGAVTVETVASRYVAAIREVQPLGPYLLGGHCFGSLVALEAAQQLHAAGDLVSLLAVFDPVRLRAGTAEKSPWMTRARRRLRRLSDLRTALGSSRRARSNGVSNPHALYVAPSEPELHQSYLAQGYAARPYSGPVCFFFSTGRIGVADEYESGWRAIASAGLERVMVAGSHSQLLDEPAVLEVAQHLNRRLEAADAALARPARLSY